MYRSADLKVEPMNIAIPVALIRQDDKGQLLFTFYVQLSEGFLSQMDLQQAVEVRNKKNCYSIHACT